MTSATITNTHQLCEAFAEFEDASQQLSAFYAKLERQVLELTTELSLSRAGQAREIEEKQRLAARLNTLLDALPGGVVVLDQRGTVQEFNPAAVELLGPLNCGDQWHSIVARAFAPRWDDGHDLSLADGRRVNIATQALCGEPGQILLLKDVSETRLLQDQLTHHKRLSAKTEMAAAMAHQIRTPLAAALLNVGNLRRGRSAAERERAVERGLQSLRKLERLVDEMLLFARGGRLAVEPVDARELLAAIESAAREAFPITGFTLDFASLAVGGRVYANLAALTSVSLNLIDNACHACRSQGRVAVTAQSSGGELRLSFQDDGPGIDAEQAAQIFEPFFTTRANGTGLGLAVARAVTVAHGGELELAAPSGSGACFVMRLPLIARQAEPSAPFTPTQTHAVAAYEPAALRQAG